MSESNVARLMKKYLNASFTEYLNQVRIQNSKRLLEQGVPIKEAAAQSGYNNLNYYYRVFKKTYQMTPKEYTMKLEI